MTAKEFFEKLEQFGKTGVVTLSPGPFKIRFGEDDMDGARFLGKLLELTDDTTTIGQSETTLLNSMMEQIAKALDKGTPIEDLWHVREVRGHLMAWWWLLFFTAQVTEDDKN